MWSQICVRDKNGSQQNSNSGPFHSISYHFRDKHFSQQNSKIGYFFQNFEPMILKYTALTMILQTYSTHCIYWDMLQDKILRRLADRPPARFSPTKFAYRFRDKNFLQKNGKSSILANLAKFWKQIIKFSKYGALKYYNPYDPKSSVLLYLLLFPR